MSSYVSSSVVSPSSSVPVDEEAHARMDVRSLVLPRAAFFLCDDDGDDDEHEDAEWDGVDEEPELLQRMYSSMFILRCLNGISYWDANSDSSTAVDADMAA